MKNNVRTLEIFNTLEAFKRREYKLVKECIGSFAITTGTALGSSILLPDVLALVPTVIVGLPTCALALKKAGEADKVSRHADYIFKENSSEIMNFRLNSLEEKEQFTKEFPTLSKRYTTILK